MSSLPNRTMDVVSENNDNQTELTYVTNVLLANGYPKQQIEKIKRKIMTKNNLNTYGRDNDRRTKILC